MKLGVPRLAFLEDISCGNEKCFQLLLQGGTGVNYTERKQYSSITLCEKDGHV